MRVMPLTACLSANGATTSTHTNIVQVNELTFVCNNAGHAGAVLGDTWYIAGGGNNTSGCTDMLALDLSPLAGDSPSDEPLTWSTVSHADARSAIVSEGMTVQAVASAKCLLAFGGYNGKYQNALQVFKAGEQSMA